MDPWNSTSSDHGQWSYSNSKDVINMDNPDLNTDRPDLNTEGEDNSELMEEKTFKTRVQKFGDTTTLHGARYVTTPKYHGLRRIIWVLLIVGLNSYLWMSIIGSFVKYFQHPVDSFVKMSYSTNLTFPAVTICNYNQFRKSAVGEELIDLLALIYNPSSFQDNSINWTIIDNTIRDRGYKTEDIVWNGAHQIEDMLQNCSWRMLKPCGAENFTKVITDWGVCYTFNEPQDSSDALAINQPGNNNGLFVRLNIEQDEYVYGEDSAAGIKILLHPQGVRPLVRELGFSVSPGFETSVSVRLTKHTNLQYPFPSNCKATEDGTKYSKLYTVHNCQYECRISYAVDKCKCRDYRYPGNATFCSPQLLKKCLYPKEEEFVEQNLGTSCKCPIPCDSRNYEGKISIAYLPGRHIVKALMERLNASKEYIRENFLDLKIFFESMSYETVTEVGSYSSDTMLSDIGGQMGLLAGMSLVTLAEFIDFFIAICCEKYGPSQTTRRKSIVK
ncbi:acid-sensing ion channel 1-like [Amphiura filiformis]|uniref:acid-sensing ion channel 1-like n=1 Tax=Amphiura filiformis TaxID=82378 RepID=UPI003B21CC13